MVGVSVISFEISEFGATVGLPVDAPGEPVCAKGETIGESVGNPVGALLETWTTHAPANAPVAHIPD